MLENVDQKVSQSATTIHDSVIADCFSVDFLTNRNSLSCYKSSVDIINRVIVAFSGPLLIVTAVEFLHVNRVFINHLRDLNSVVLPTDSSVR